MFALTLAAILLALASMCSLPAVAQDTTLLIDSRSVRIVNQVGDSQRRFRMSGEDEPSRLINIWVNPDGSLPPDTSFLVDVSMNGKIETPEVHTQRTRGHRRGGCWLTHAVPSHWQSEWGSCDDRIHHHRWRSLSIQRFLWTARRDHPGL
jgi:hypothetical protein